MPSEYDKAAARFLLDVLGSSQGVRTTFVGTCDGSRIGTDRDVTSDYPSWYRHATHATRKGGLGYDGDNIRDALSAVAEGRDPNMGQREARWIMERIAAADPDMGLPERPRGGGKRGRAQASHGKVAVSRVPLRIPDATLAVLKERADARGMSLNLYLVRLLDDVASRPEPETEDAPF